MCFALLFFLMLPLSLCPRLRWTIAVMTVMHFSNSPQLIQGLSLPRARESQHLVLIGGGHAHAQVLKALNQKARPSNLKVTLIDVQRNASYSGMVPGCVSKLYKPEETLLHLEPLCKWAGIDFVNDEVVDINLDNKCLIMKNSNECIAFDAVSVDIGSTSRGLDETPGAREFTIPTRPISKLVGRIERAEHNLGENAHVVVVGGGAAGIELCMSLHGRWEPILGTLLRVTLLDAGSELLPNESLACRDALSQIFADKGIAILHHCHVQEITSDHVMLDNGERVSYTHCIWATGAAAHPVAHRLGKRGLAITKRGWIRVNQNLQSVSHPFLFAAGDCSNLEGLAAGAPPKAGVYAVRAGPILIDNLTGYLGQKPLLQYTPQEDFLKLLVCGDGTALGFRFGRPIRGRWVMQLKDHIDRMFMSLFKEENLPNLDDGASYDTSQYDARDDSGRNLLVPSEAAVLLQRTDDDVNYVIAWDVLRDMVKDEGYKAEVLALMG
jgi:selenide, water dikinase